MLCLPIASCTMMLLPSLTLFILPLVLTEEGVDLVYANHRYLEPDLSHTPRTLQKPLLAQRTPIQPQRKMLQMQTRTKSNSSLPVKMAMVKRSGDYHYMNMEYPQYDIDDHGHPMYHHVPNVRTVFYKQPPMVSPMYEKQSKFDVSSLGVVALIKLVLLKIVSFGMFKLILLFLIKFPLILFTLAFKFFIILKLIKLVKLLTIPIIIPFILILVAPILIIGFFLLLPLILPLILAPVIPFILIPILLPLLLSLPVPVLAPTTGRRRRQADPESRGVSDDVLYLVRRVLESEQCIERVACQLAASKQSRGYTTFVAWYLEKAASFVNKPRFTSYKDAYKRGSKLGVPPQHCTRLYACNNPRSLL